MVKNIKKLTMLPMKKKMLFSVRILSCICVFLLNGVSYAQSIKVYEICVNEYCLLDTNNIELIGESREIIYCNNNRTQYLKMVHHAGDFAKQYSIFEVGRYVDTVADVFICRSDLSFVTNSGTCLDQTIDQICRIQGEPHSIHKYGDYTTLYYAEEDDSSSFLTEYGEWKYHMEYYFFKGQLIKFVFGFDYP